MKELTKKEILDVMRIAAGYQRKVYQLYEFSIIDVTKFHNCLSISVNYTPCEVSFKKLYSIFLEQFVKYKEFIKRDSCYSSRLSGGNCVAHFKVYFYA